METVEKDAKLPPICACCRERITDLWAVTQPKVYVICRKPLCEGWARSQGLTFAVQGVMGVRRTFPARVQHKRRRPTCDHCGQPRRSARHAFMSDRRAPDGHLIGYCTLTCQQAAEGSSST